MGEILGKCLHVLDYNYSLLQNAQTSHLIIFFIIAGFRVYCVYSEINDGCCVSFLECSSDFECDHAF